MPACKGEAAVRAGASHPLESGSPIIGEPDRHRRYIVDVIGLVTNAGQAEPSRARATGESPSCSASILNSRHAARSAAKRGRRQFLEDLDLDGDYWSTTPSHEDGESLWEKVCELGLEGVVAKKRSGHYLPGRRGWIKTKNRDYWRYPLELEAAMSR
jgi:hypothetical protein